MLNFFHVKERCCSIVECSGAYEVWVAFSEVVPIGWEQDLGAFYPGQTKLLDEFVISNPVNTRIQNYL